MALVLNIIMFFNSRLAITIGSSATAPFLAMILIYLQYQGITFEDMINGLAVPIIFITLIYGILHFIIEIQDFLINKRIMRIKSKIIEPFETKKAIEEALQQDITPELFDMLLFDKEKRNQFLYSILDLIAIYEKHGIVEIGEIDLDELKKQLENVPITEA
ncbi:MAG: hypothetical protein ACTSO7_07910 [Candidatus Heimdallarchaeota archaeon]